MAQPVFLLFASSSRQNANAGLLQPTTYAEDPNTVAH